MRVQAKCDASGVSGALYQLLAARLHDIPPASLGRAARALVELRLYEDSTAEAILELAAPAVSTMSAAELSGLVYAHGWCRLDMPANVLAACDARAAQLLRERAVGPHEVSELVQGFDKLRLCLHETVRSCMRLCASMTVAALP